MQRIILICTFILTSLFMHSQDAQRTYTLAILSDKFTPEIAPLLAKLTYEITAVVGQDARISFYTEKPLTNEFSIETARANYSKVVKDPTVDAVLLFGVVNNTMIFEMEQFAKPVILFGSVNKDFVSLPEGKNTTGIPNFTYIISPQSISNDLIDFKKLYPFKKIGILVEESVVNYLPLEAKLKEISTVQDFDYKIILLDDFDNAKKELLDVDAVYAMGGFYLGKEKHQELISFFNQHKLPSFSGVSEKDVEDGMLASNQPSLDYAQLFRRIALNVEALVAGENAANLPIYLNLNERLTVNIATASKIDVPLRYSMISQTDIVGEVSDFLADKEYTYMGLLEDVLGRNLSLQNSKKDISIQEQEKRLANSAYLPEASVGGLGTYVDPDIAAISNGQNPEYKVSGTVSVSQLVYSEAANANKTIQSKLLDAQEQQYKSEELDLIYSTAVAYFNALIAKTFLGIQKENLAVTKKNLDIANQNFNAGQSGKGDILRFESELAQTTQDLIVSANQLKLSYNGINQLTNSPIGTDLNIKDVTIDAGEFSEYSHKRLAEILDNPLLREPFVAYIIKVANENAPELKALLYQMEANERSINLYSRGRFAPTVALQGQYNHTFDQWGEGASAVSPFPALPNSNYNAGVSLSLPIFQQNQNNINKTKATIQQEQLDLQKENLQLAIEKNIYDVVLDITSQISSITLSEVSAKAAKESLDLMQISYTSGAVTITQLIDAQRNYISAESSKANAYYNFLLATLRMERFMGYYFLLHSQEENDAFIARFNEFLLTYSKN